LQNFDTSNQIQVIFWRLFLVITATRAKSPEQGRKKIQSKLGGQLIGIRP
jgi:hypothetical protein